MASQMLVEIDTDENEKSITLTLTFPDKRLEFKGTVDSLASLVDSDMKLFEQIIGEKGVVKFRADLDRILMEIREDFNKS